MRKTYLFLLFLLATLSGCNLDLAPENTMVDETVYKNKNTAEAALMGAYVRLNIAISGGPSDQNYYPNMGYVYLFGDAGTDNLKAQATSSDFMAMETSNYTESEHNGFLYTVWRNAYNGIDYANNIIKGIKTYGAYDEKSMRQHVAEARFIRAYIYLHLLQMFGDQALMGNDEGPGVLLRLEPYDGYDPELVVKRATNAETWKQIIADLTEPLADLPETAPASVTERLRATQPVVKALLSRLYLYKGTYTNNQEELTLAKNYADEVLKSGGYTFASDSTEYLTKLFPLNIYSSGDDISQPTDRSSEIIFFEASRLQADLYPSGIYSYYGKRSFYVPVAMKDYYEADDVRGYNPDTKGTTFLLGQGSPTENATLITSMKYSNSSSSDYNNDVIYIRLAEVKLTYAEALVRTQKAVTQEAVGQLNDVRRRAFAEDKRPRDYTTGDFGTVDAFLKTLLKERNRELAYEGLYRWDIIRTNNLLEDATMSQVPSNRWNAPISSYELEISNGNIEQNSGYK